MEGPRDRYILLQDRPGVIREEQTLDRTRFGVGEFARIPPSLPFSDGLPTISTPIQVPKGEILEALPENEQPVDSRWIALGGINRKLLIECLREDVRKLTVQEVDLLLAISSATSRYQICFDRKRLDFGKRLEYGSQVLVSINGGSEKLPGVVRFKGSLPKLLGTMFGIELHQNPGFGTCDGTFGEKRYFECAPDPVVFVGLDKVSPLKDDNSESRTPSKSAKGDDHGQFNIKSTLDSFLTEKSDPKFPQPRNFDTLKIGQRVVTFRDKGPPLRGTVRFTDDIEDSSGHVQSVVGLELDERCGSGTGKWKGKQLFVCKRDHAYFVDFETIMLEDVFDKDAERANKNVTSQKQDKQPRDLKMQERRHDKDIPTSNDVTMPRQQFGFQLPENACRMLGYIFPMFLCYCSLMFYNRCLLQRFHSPLSISVVHYAIVVLSATYLRFFWVTGTDKRRNQLPNRSLYLKRVLPTVITWALDIGCSFWSLIYILLLSPNTMTTSTRIVFILMFAIAFGLEQWSNISQIFVGIVPLIASGLLLFTFESTESIAEGFALVIFTSGLSGLRWKIAQILAQKQELAQQALEEIQQLKDENDRLKLEKGQWEKEKSDLLAQEESFEKELHDVQEESYYEPVVQNNSLQTDLRAKEAEVHRLETTLATAQQALEECQQIKEPCDWVVSRDEVQMTDNCLGVGGWGKVVLGTFRGCKVAVNQIHELILSPDNRCLFEREMNIASRCRHPCLLQFIGATKDDGIPFFITELWKTRLRVLLGQRRLAKTEISIISLDVSLALNYLHNMKPSPIIHRDVSSANVLLWQQGNQWRGKVSDYGTAEFVQQTERGQETGAPAGAAIYRAPEAISSNQTPKVDVYSFGVLLCEMCIRKRPDPERREQQVNLVRNRVFRDGVHACLQVDPAKRPDMAQIIQEIQKFKG